MPQEDESTNFFMLLYFEGKDATRYSPEEWAKGVTYGLEDALKDPYVKFKHTEPCVCNAVLTERGAQAIIDALDLTTYFPDACAEAYPLKDDPSEDDYGFYVHFTHNLGDEELDAEKADLQLKGLDIVEEFTDNCKCSATALTEEEDEDGNVVECHGYVYYEINYLFTSEEEKRTGVWTDTPVFTSVLNDYNAINGDKPDVMRTLINYVNYVITTDLTSKIDGYEESPRK